LSGDAASGAAGLSSSNAGLIGGADMRLSNGLLIGVAGSVGWQDFNSGNGTGTSDDTMVGLYARQDAGRFYVSAAFGYGRHQITTLRTVTVSGTDVLQGKLDADEIGGRLEAGWRMPLAIQFGLSPYAAVSGARFESPAYVETALSGASTFALSYASHSSTLGRSEVGVRLDRSYPMKNNTVSANLGIAWAHQLDDLPFAQASFQTLPGAGFVVTGVRPAKDTALLGLDLEVQSRSGLFFGVKGETQLGARTTILEGMGSLGWRW
ncbi:MAG: autotransporter outer membrane beta-barrel domain-containing protein, partial [Alphaproteobacteria bacterium]|nr:autotransporter outer membrane beta-barrel domain-containing protein [Alphaproteobacteria bacterium]